MKNSSFFKELIDFVLVSTFSSVMVCAGAYANPPVESASKKAEAPTPTEYKAVTKFKRCLLVVGPKYCEGEEAKNSADMMEEIQPAGAEPADIKACEAIADNINEMSRANYDWRYGFAISAHNYLLSLPPWIELSEKERCDALNVLRRSTPPMSLAQCAVDGISRVYSFSYNLDYMAKGDEKIYIRKARLEKNGPFRRVIWTANNDGSRRVSGGVDLTYNSEKIDRDPVLFSSRLYFVEYDNYIDGHEKYLNGEKGFAVYAYPLDRERYSLICAIRSIPLTTPPQQ